MLFGARIIRIFILCQNYDKSFRLLQIMEDKTDDILETRFSYQGEYTNG